MINGKLLIDSHVHVTEAGYFIRQDGSKKDAKYRYLLREMIFFGIDKALLLPIGKMPNYGNQKIANEFVSRLVKEHPDKFFTFGSIDGLTKQEIDLFKDQCEQLNLKGFKIHPILQDINPGDERLFPLYEFCQEEQLPIVFHSGMIRTECEATKYANPECIRPVVENFCNLKVIIAHMGCGSREPCYFDQALDIAQRHENVYLGISFASQEILRKAIDTFGFQRLIFESDFPYWGIENAINLIEPYLNDKDIDYCLHKNISDLIGV